MTYYKAYTVSQFTIIINAAYRDPIQYGYGRVCIGISNFPWNHGCTIVGQNDVYQFHLQPHQDRDLPLR